MSPSFDVKIPLDSATSRRRQSVSGSTLHTGFSEISSGGIGLMVNIFGESSKEDKPAKGHKRGISVTLHSHIDKRQWEDSSDDEWSGNESLESNKARVGRRPAPVEPSMISRPSQSGSRRPRDTSLTSPIISSATMDIKRSQQATSGRQSGSAATSTSARGSDMSYKRSSHCSEKGLSQSSTRERRSSIGERRSSIGDKLSSSRGKQKEMPSIGGRTASKPPVPASTKENAPPEIEIPPRYDTKTHVCYCCGKTRSKNFQLDHPIDAGIGAKPSLCGPCSYNIELSGNLPGRLEHKRAYLAGLHWCATCGTLRSTKFHLTQKRRGSKSNLSKLCAVYETGADKEAAIPITKNSNRTFHRPENSQESSPSCTTVDSPNTNYPSSDDEAPQRRTTRQALRSILINMSTNDRDTGHSAGSAWVSKVVSESSSETHVHFTNPEISGLTEVPNYDRSPIELDYPGQASHSSPMIPSARRAQPVAEQPSTESSSSPNLEPPRLFPRPASHRGVPKGMGVTDPPSRDTAVRGDVPQRSDDFRRPAPFHEDVPPQDVRPPRPSSIHHSKPSYQPVQACDGCHNDHIRRWSTPEHHPVLQNSIPTKDYRNSADYPSVQPQFHHFNPQREDIRPLSGYRSGPPTGEATRPFSGYCPPHVDDYCTTPSLADEPIHHPPHFSNSSTDTFGCPRSPGVHPEPPYMTGGQPPQPHTFAPRAPSPEEPSYDAAFFPTASDPSSTRSSQTLRPSGSGSFSTGPSPVFSSSSSRGPSPNTDSSTDQGSHAFSSDAQRRAESEARMFAAAGFSKSMAEEAEVKLENPSGSVIVCAPPSEL